MPKHNPLASLIFQAWKYSSGNRRNVLIFIFFAVIANCVMLAEPVIIGRIFNSVQFSSQDPALLGDILKNLSQLLLVTLVFWLFHGTSRVLEKQNAFLVRKKFKQELIGEVLDLPASWHKNHHSGNTIDKVGKASESLFAFSGNIYSIVQSAVRLAGALSILTFFDWRASLLAVVASLLAIVSMLKFDGILRGYYAKIFKAENHLASAIHDYVSNIITILTLKLKPRVAKEVKERAEAGFPIYKKSLVVTELKWFWVNFLIVLMVVGVLALHALQSYRQDGLIVIGTLFTLYRYLQSVGDVFSGFASRYGDFVQQDAAIRALEDIRIAHRQVEKGLLPVLPHFWEKLEVKGLMFSYEKRQGQAAAPKHLHNVNLSVKKGQKVAFIGESGSGKSTVLGLLRGLYAPAKGDLVCDGEKLPYGLGHLHNHVTLIPQEPELFNSTIEDNITMDTKVSPAMLDEVIDMARFRPVLDRLPMGLQTNVLEKGVSMSGGEKQRLALARGLLAVKSGGGKKDFLFLDEPTSNVDAANELKIFGNIFSTFKQMTIISTVHRLHLLNFFDYVFFFKEGTVAAEGALEEIKRHPEFQRLWNSYYGAYEAPAGNMGFKQWELSAQR